MPTISLAGMVARGPRLEADSIALHTLSELTRQIISMRAGVSQMQVE